MGKKTVSFLLRKDVKESLKQKALEKNMTIANLIGAAVDTTSVQETELETFSLQLSPEQAEKLEIQIANAVSEFVENLIYMRSFP